MAPVPQEVINDAMLRFVAATGNEALRKAVCCARRLPVSTLEETATSDIPSQHCLDPTHPHPSQVLIRNMLLYNQAVENDKGQICTDCMTELRSGKRPSLSLANNMWIGDVPPPLSVLSLPERVLIARYFPAAYIVKLYPKRNGTGFDPRALNSGVRGNVTTYPLNVAALAKYVDGNSLPPHPRVLAATIGITFIGVKGTPEKAMRGLFSVSRERVRQALKWLKEFNEFYQHITINETTLQALPDDGVPPELLQVAKMDSDSMLLEREHAGYVPDEEDEEPRLFSERGMLSEKAASTQLTQPLKTGRREAWTKKPAPLKRPMSFQYKRTAWSTLKHLTFRTRH